MEEKWVVQPMRRSPVDSELVQGFPIGMDYQLKERLDLNRKKEKKTVSFISMSGYLKKSSSAHFPITQKNCTANKFIKYLIKRGLWSWLQDLLGSSCLGSPGKPPLGPGRLRESGIYEGQEQPDFLQDTSGQTAQDCSPLAHLHSSDLHPWPHQTDLHLKQKRWL